MKKLILLDDAGMQARQVASRAVTRRPDDRCTLDAAGAPLDHAEKCAWCATRAPRPAHLLLNVPTKLVVHPSKLRYSKTKLGGTRA
jgi:hypothetical protein